MLLPRTTSDFCESSIFGILAATNACGFIRRAGVWDSNGHSFSNDTRLTCEFGTCGAGPSAFGSGPSISGIKSYWAEIQEHVAKIAENPEGLGCSEVED